MAEKSNSNPKMFAKMITNNYKHMFDNLSKKKSLMLLHQTLVVFAET